MTDTETTESLSHESLFAKHVMPAAVVCFLLSVLAFFSFGYLCLPLVIGACGILGCGGRIPTELVLIFSLGIIPPGAIYFFGYVNVSRNLEEAVVSAQQKKRLILSFLTVPIIIVSFIFAIIVLHNLPIKFRQPQKQIRTVYVAKDHTKTKSWREWNHFKKKLLNEPVDIKIHQARLIDEYHTGHTGGIIELTLQIENVPDYLPKYKFFISTFDNEGLFSMPGYSSVWEASNHDGSWIFHKLYRHPVYSAHSLNGKLVLTIPFSRHGATAEEYPKTIIPTLKISPADDKDYKETVFFFKKPVSFELIHAVEEVKATVAPVIEEAKPVPLVIEETKPQTEISMSEKEKETLDSLSKLKDNSAAPRTFGNARYNRVSTEPKN